MTVEFDAYAKFFPASGLVSRAAEVEGVPINFWERRTELGWVTLPLSILVVVPLEALSTTILSIPINAFA